MTGSSTGRAARSGRPVSFQFAILLVATTLPVLATGSGLETCRSIVDDRERLACYDTIADNKLPAKDSETPTGISAESLFGRDAAQTSAVLQRQTGITPPETLDTAISSVETRASGKLLLTLQNGQRWEQIDGRPPGLAAGDQVRIRKGAFGSYLLYKQSGGRSMRVRRID
ncbi:MAG: hypothetical protein KJ049_13555 [Gammaproteobacteria bacterium]|jgi:hypothetical protein|nr:hypothetical protein [Gammaproteobacteria bacterium]